MLPNVQIDQTTIDSPHYVESRPAVYERHTGLTKQRAHIQRNSMHAPFGYVLNTSLGRPEIDNIENQGTRIEPFNPIRRMASLSVKDYELMMADYDVAAIENDHSQIARQFGW